MNKNLAKQRNTCSTLTQDALALKQNKVYDNSLPVITMTFSNIEMISRSSEDYTIPVHIYAHFKLYSRYQLAGVKV